MNQFYLFLISRTNYSAQTKFLKRKQIGPRRNPCSLWLFLFRKSGLSSLVSVSYIPSLSTSQFLLLNFKVLGSLVEENRGQLSSGDNIWKCAHHCALLPGVLPPLLWPRSLVTLQSFWNQTPFLPAPPDLPSGVRDSRGAPQGQQGGSFMLQASSQATVPTQVPEASNADPWTHLTPKQLPLSPSRTRGKSFVPGPRSSTWPLEGPGDPSGDLEQLTVLINKLLMNFLTAKQRTQGRTHRK